MQTGDICNAESALQGLSPYRAAGTAQHTTAGLICEKGKEIEVYEDEF